MRHGLILMVLALATAGLSASVWLREVDAERPVRPAALDRARVSADALPASMNGVLAEGDFAAETSRHVAQDLYLVERNGTQLCYMAFFGSSRSGGCNAKNDFFGGRAIVVGLGQDRAVAAGSLAVAGIARPDVARIRIQIGSETNDVEVNGDGGFSFSTALTASSHLPPTVTVDAVGRNGRTIGSYAVPTD